MALDQLPHGGDEHVELSCLHARDPLVLRVAVEEVVGLAADQDVYLKRHQAETGGLTEALQVVADGRAPMHTGEEVGDLQRRHARLRLHQNGAALVEGRIDVLRPGVRARVGLPGTVLQRGTSAIPDGLRSNFWLR